MYFFNIIFFLCFVFVIAKALNAFIAFWKYKKKERELYQLIQLYHILERFECGLRIERQNLSDGIILENKWLYTKSFFFDITDTNTALRKVEQYLTELMSFFLMYDYNQNRKTFGSLVEFKKMLNVSLGA